ncbi:MAG: hypothetical protein E7195_03225 [Peptococcaceae bacterium]|nr:hypothetical protein [Peptococcaceae bacterium]
MTFGWKKGLLISVLLVMICCSGCQNDPAYTQDSLMEMIQKELNVTGELQYGATCGKARLGNDDAVIWYYTTGNEQKNIYIPVEVKVVGEARYKFVSFLETTEPAQDIVTADWQNGCCIFVNNPECVTVEVIGEDSTVRTEKNTDIYPMLYYYDDFELREIRFLDAEGNAIM